MRQMPIQEDRHTSRSLYSLEKSRLYRPIYSRLDRGNYEEVQTTRCELIADIGCNHQGNIFLAKKMIKKAAAVGCTYAKFQYYSADEIMEYERRNPPSLYTKGTLAKIRATEFTIDQLYELKSCCDRVKIEFLCTPFINPKRIDHLNAIVKRWKIRERDGRDPTDNKLIETALKTHKEVFVSTTRLPMQANLLYHPKILWLFTIPKYPASLSGLDLARVSNYQGYSNHIPTILAPLATAISARIKGKNRWIIEVHVTLGHNLDVIDKDVSFDFQELELLINYIKEIEKCNSTPELF